MAQGKLLQSVITPHSPRMMVEESAPPFLRDVIAGSYELGEAIRAEKPDLLIVHSTHWVTSFTWFVTGHAVHHGTCIADEAPDMFPGIPYERPGDPVFAQELVARLTAAEIQSGLNVNDHFDWDYGSLVPLRYIDPGQTIPVVLVGTCLMASLDECLRAGEVIRETVEATGRRAVFLSSTALAHKILRGPAIMPPPEHVAADNAFIDQVCAGDIKGVKARLPDYARSVVAEMGGRNIATMLGTIDDTAPVQWTGRRYGGYGQSSGSGNISFAVRPAA